ncbi:MAG: hypothetical protein NTW14_08475 [bacterium]|nr:hypothetical protein [bacterium]
MAEQYLTTFPNLRCFKETETALTELKLPHQIISPEPAYERVGVPAIVVSPEVRSTLLAERGDELVISGWVEYHPPAIEIPKTHPKVFDDDIFGQVAIMVLSPCIAIRSKIRFIAHLTGNLEAVFPYLNSEVPTVFYNANAPSVYFKQDYRAISLYPQRIAAGKADEIVDAWRLLEMVRCQVNEIWARRDSIKPSFKMREKPSVLDILKRLPGTNCGQCGEKTCLAFASRIWSGTSPPMHCKPIFDGNYGHLREELTGICAGVAAED